VRREYWFEGGRMKRVGGNIGSRFTREIGKRLEYERSMQESEIL
jgi:hypothetical protein